VLWDEDVVERDSEAKRNVMISRVVLADSGVLRRKGAVPGHGPAGVG